MRTIAIVLAVLLFGSPAMAASCGFVDSDGGRVTWMQHSDYDFEVAAPNQAAAKCSLLRDEKGTHASCDNGLDSEFFYGSTQPHGGRGLLAFDHRIWYADGNCPAGSQASR